MAKLVIKILLICLVSSSCATSFIISGRGQQGVVTFSEDVSKKRIDIAKVGMKNTKPKKFRKTFKVTSFLGEFGPYREIRTDKYIKGRRIYLEEFSIRTTSNFTDVLLSLFPFFSSRTVTFKAYEN